MKKNLILALFLAAVLSGYEIRTFAMAELKISGTMYSVNDREVALQRGARIYYIRKAALLPDEIDRITNSHGSTVTVRIDMRSITRIVNLAKNSAAR